MIKEHTCQLSIKKIKTMNETIFLRIQLVLLFFCGMAMSMDAQTYYRCTGNRVNVRSGPGKNYAVLVCEYQGMNEPQQLMKGHVVKYLGKKQNGFMYVEDTIDWHWSSFGIGWVSSQFLTPATKCTSCNGRGRFNRKCPECHGQGCPMYNAGSCDNGYVRCEKCSGAGYR